MIQSTLSSILASSNGKTVWDDTNVAIVVIGILAAICFAACSIPGLVKVIKTKDTSSLSLSMFIVMVTGSFLFVLVAIISMAHDAQTVPGQVGVLIGNAACLGITLAIIIIKAKNMKNAKYNGMNERQWCDKLFKEYQEKKAVKPATETTTDSPKAVA